MGFIKSTKGSIISDYFKLLDDLGNYKSGDMVDVALYDNHLIISTKAIKQEITLNYSQIKDVFHGRKAEIIETNKSVIGRAVAGGLLFGGAGAVVGAISANGTKESKEIRLYFIISYTGTDGEDKFLRFEDTRMYKGKKLAKQLKEFCNITDNTSSKNNNNNIQL